MWFLMSLVKFFQKRPTDKTILIGRFIFWILYIFVMYYNLFYLDWKWITNTYIFWLIQLNQEQTEILKYVFTWIWIIPIFMWSTNICLLKKKYLRIIQIIFWFILFYIAWSINSSPDLDFDILIWFMWLFPLLWWATWKCITTKCLRYKEKVTKIRI